MGDIDWGDAPTWLGVVFAAAAALATFWTLASQRKQLKEQGEFIRKQQEVLSLERRELLATARERRRAQAVKVRMKVGLDGGYYDEPSETYLGADRWFVEVTNGSDAPLYDVIVRYGDGSFSAVVTELPRGITLEAEPKQWSSQKETKANPPLLLFTDDARVRWSLDRHGHLEEVADYSRPEE
ncbi:MAG TPA: hypothetical protein VFY14_13555 [Streptomyces sp.]|nr:hypothetical protein [Streptomyces sp.]